jgi:succinate dehydrogenase flavin-adding protein (antitoxin of CptAB toxin-antitoxin module)
MELDLWLHGFLAAGRATLTPRELAAFERLLDAPDMDLLDWLQGRRAADDEELGAIIERLQRYRILQDAKDSHAQL